MEVSDFVPSFSPLTPRPLEFPPLSAPRAAAKKRFLFAMADAEVPKEETKAVRAASRARHRPLAPAPARPDGSAAADTPTTGSDQTSASCTCAGLPLPVLASPVPPGGEAEHLRACAYWIAHARPETRQVTDRVLSRVRCRTRLLMRLLPLRSPRRLAPPPSLQPRPVVMVTAMTMSSRKRRRRKCAAHVDSP